MLNPEIVIFNDFLTYSRPPTWKNISKSKSKAEPFVITNTHDPQQLQYQFTPTGVDPESITLEDQWKENVKEILKDESWELGKDALGLGLIGLGTWLLNPVGPEDLLSPSPVDEIIGIGLIWTGRFIMWL